MYANILATFRNFSNISAKYMDDQKMAELAKAQENREPIGFNEMQESLDERVQDIALEFTNGFNFLKKFPKSVTFFGSARYKEGNEYYDKARRIAGRIAKELGYAVVTGGGPGIMEAANRGTLENGGKSVGLTIDLPHIQHTNDYLSDSLDFYYFFSRKVCLTYSSEAFLFFPGGFGTMDEFFEIITLLQTRKIPDIPAILVGEEYWKKMENVMKDNLLSRGTIDEQDLKTFEITDDEDKIIDIIKNATVRTSIPYRGTRVSPIEE